MTTRICLSATDALEHLKYPERQDSGFLDAALKELIRSLKAQAVQHDDQHEALLLWKAQTISALQLNFFDAFLKLKAGGFYEAWCQFERCEIDLLALRRHHVVSEEDLHRIGFIETMISRWQSLYPYAVFFSPEILKKKMLCSVCEAVVTPRSTCGHQKHEVYNGELCCHKVVEAEILGLSIVKDPVQRYSVAFLSNEKGEQVDHYNYGNLKFAADRVSSPWHEWVAEKTTRQLTGADVAHLDGDVACPCGSETTFQNCCSGKSTVVVPHLQFAFSVAPPVGLPTNELLL